jgi:integrase
MGKLSAKKLESLTEKDANRKLFDGEGLYGKVRLQKTGVVVTFEYRFKLHSKTRTSTCGKWPDDSLRAIRINRDKKRLLIESGIDPVEQAKSERLQKKVNLAQEIEHQNKELERIATEAASRRTFRDAVAQWKKLELVQRKDSGAEVIRAFEKDVLPSLGDLPMIDIKRGMLTDIFDSIIERGSRVMANHLFGDLRQFFNFAATREWIESNPLAGISKDKVGSPPKERDRYLSEEEIIELNTHLPTANLLQTTEIAIWIMLSTCCRVGTISQAKWEDIDFEQGEWFIPAGNSKNAKPQTIFLSDFTKHQFKELHTITGKNDWCLPTRGGKNHICLKSIAKQIKDRIRDDSFSKRTKAKRTLQLPGGDWTPHDLRRTGATMMGELGVMGEIIERCLNHVEQNKLKRIYQRQERKTEQHEAWRLLGERLTLLLKSSQNSNSNIVIGHFRNSG